MLGRLFKQGSAFPAGERARRVHEAWLTRVMETGMPVPRIPVRLVADGGFAVLVADPVGRRWADTWWKLALERLDPDA